MHVSDYNDQCSPGKVSGPSVTTQTGLDIQSIMCFGRIKNDTLPPDGILDLVSNHYLEIKLHYSIFELDGWIEDGTLPLG